MKNQKILLANRPEGKPIISNFKFIDEEVPQIQEGELLLKTRFISVDPYLRGRMNTAKSYIPPFELNQPISSGIIAEVISSKNNEFIEGDWLSGILQWAKYQSSYGNGLIKIDPKTSSPTSYLGVLGLTGLTAYLGLTEIGKPQKGETVVVSGAAGAVGSIVGQIAKIQGCRVIGIVGTDEKAALIKTKFGFDEAINYKTTKDIPAAITAAAPDGVDVYFDNVGDTISDAVYVNLNKFSRIVVCGSIAVYNETTATTRPRIEPILIKNSVLMQGFIVTNYSSKFPEAIKQLGQWLKNGEMHHVETIVKGFENTPQAFLDLFSGINIGKMIVQVE